MNAIIVLDTRDYHVYIDMSDSVVSDATILESVEFSRAEQAQYYVEDNLHWLIRNNYSVEVHTL